MSDKALTELESIGTLTDCDTGDELYVVHGGNSRRVHTGGLGALEAFLSSDWHNVRSFGASGDGVTQDQAAFAAAVAAAEASAIKTVYVPDSVLGYVLGAAVALPTGIVLRGDNRKGLELSRIKPAPGYSGALIESENYGVSRVLRIGVIGLFLDGSSTTLTAIQVNAQESVFCDLTVKNCFTYGLHLGGISSASDAQALNNLIASNFFAGTIGSTEFFDGIFIDYFSADNTVTENYVEASKDAGIRSRGYNNKITNNHIYSVAGTGGGVGVGIYTETSADHDISQNYIELCAAEAILMQGGGSDVATLAAAIHGNVFRNIDTGNTSNGVIEFAGSDVSAISVTGNVVRRDAATSYSTPYFVYFNGVTPVNARAGFNTWQDGLITTAETNQSANYTQQTNKATAVPVTTLTGLITLNNATLNGGVSATFSVTNAAIAQTDFIGINWVSGGTANAYRFDVVGQTAGAFTVRIANITGGNLGESPIINYRIFKGS